MDEQKLIDAVVQGVKTGVKDALKAPERDFTYVPREEHYRHHEFLGEVIELMRGGKKTVMQTILRGAVLGLIALIGYGIYYLITIKTGGV